MMTDAVTEECRRIRDEIVRRAGSFDAYFDNLEELDRQRLASEAAKRPKNVMKNPLGKKRRKRKTDEM